MPRVPANWWKFHPQVCPSWDQPCPGPPAQGRPECLWAVLTQPICEGKETADLKSFPKGAERTHRPLPGFLREEEMENEGRGRPLTFFNNP